MSTVSLQLSEGACSALGIYLSSGATHGWTGPANDWAVLGSWTHLLLPNHSTPPAGPLCSGGLCWTEGKLLKVAL